VINQAAARQWAEDTFGMMCMDKHERAMRFLEEAFEAAQAAGVTDKDAVCLWRVVYDKPVGELAQEIGGALLTLALLSEGAGLDMEWAGDTEFLRARTMPRDYIKARHAVKVAAGVAR